MYKPSLLLLPNIGPSNLSFVRIYAQGILTGFLGFYISMMNNMKTKKDELLTLFGVKKHINLTKS